MSVNRQLRLIFGIQALLLMLAAWRNASQLNPDAVAYCRIAGYYAEGQWALAVSGYWGPLLSWLMVPLVKFGCAPLVAARIVMAFSGCVFLAGAVTLFRAFRLPRPALLAGSGMAAAWSVFWSVRNISPDLLMAGLAGLAMAATYRAVLSNGSRKPSAVLGIAHVPETVASPRQGVTNSLAIRAGTLWGLAYLAKAIALPWALLVSAGFALFATSGRPDLRRQMLKRLGGVCLGLALVAGPWVALLSFHYGKFTFSTTGPIAHALAGPGEASRYHPAMISLHQPDAGRVTQWEEPSRMTYRYWSPFADLQSWQHQLRVVQGNAGVIAGWLLPADAWLAAESQPAWRRWLATFDFFGLGMVALWIGFLTVLRDSGQLRRKRWLWAVIPVATLATLYLPFFVMKEDNRYFYAVWPLFWLMVLACRPRATRWRQLFWHVALASFALPAGLWCAAGLVGLPNSAAESARHWARELKAAGVRGPVAGSGLLPGGRSGLYTAFLMGDRWLGDAPAAPEVFAGAGARIVMLGRADRWTEAFALSPQWREFQAGSSTGELRVFIARD